MTGDVVDLKDTASISAFLDRLGPFDHLAITAGDVGTRERVFASTEDLDLALARDAFELRFWGAFADYVVNGTPPPFQRRIGQASLPFRESAPA